MLQSRHWGLPPKTPVKSTDVANQNLHLPHPLILQLPTKWVCNFLYYTFAINIAEKVILISFVLFKMNSKNTTVNSIQELDRIRDEKGKKN